MKFYAVQKKPVNVPILSLLDILAILLIYTVVSSKFVKEDSGAGAGQAEREQAALKVEIPSTDSLPTKTIKEDRKQIVLSSDGQISFAGTIISKEILVDYLEAFKDKGGEMKLEIKADKDITLELLIFIFEALKKAEVAERNVLWLVNDKSK